MTYPKVLNLAKHLTVAAMCIAMTAACNSDAPEIPDIPSEPMDPTPKPGKPELLAVENIADAEFVVSLTTNDLSPTQPEKANENIYCFKNGEKRPLRVKMSVDSLNMPEASGVISQCRIEPFTDGYVSIVWKEIILDSGDTLRNDGGREYVVRRDDGMLFEGIVPHGLADKSLIRLKDGSVVAADATTASRYHFKDGKISVMSYGEIPRWSPETDSNFWIEMKSNRLLMLSDGAIAVLGYIFAYAYGRDQSGYYNLAILRPDSGFYDKHFVKPYFNLVPLSNAILWFRQRDPYYESYYPSCAYIVSMDTIAPSSPDKVIQKKEIEDFGPDIFPDSWFETDNYALIFHQMDDGNVSSNGIAYFDKNTWEIENRKIVVPRGHRLGLNLWNENMLQGKLWCLSRETTYANNVIASDHITSVIWIDPYNFTSGSIPMNIDLKALSEESQGQAGESEDYCPEYFFDYKHGKAYFVIKRSEQGSIIAIDMPSASVKSILTENDGRLNWFVAL